MTADDHPERRADAIFEALDVSESVEQEREAAAFEEQAKRLQRVRERVEQDRSS